MREEVGVAHSNWGAIVWLEANLVISVFDQYWTTASVLQWAIRLDELMNVMFLWTYYWFISFTITLVNDMHASKLKEYHWGLHDQISVQLISTSISSADSAHF